MLTIPLDTLAFIIAKAREYGVEVSPVDEDTGSNPTDDGSLDILEATPDNPSRRELLGAIRALNEDELVELLALTWLGRGDYAAEEWPAALEQARERRDRREPDYLAGTPLLADYLEEALSQLGYALEDLEVP
ncbi:DUF3775 domain-containing protein [Chelatococcus sp. SYSU_G07232]|uniref:DUF3775 domain-containing protein n=1 Tax=Chelatococcus albus TaxID=3047466 RepID=A0ABT7AD57_9HYPH|nr:DUF3775 domain-containing protein [Chelatococcus sp. SYSU_G07232]MDJ1157000.1 DUF3775 domain-containing protein [Chelatococcus sp. SYSU_G07232]